VADPAAFDWAANAIGVVIGLSGAAVALALYWRTRVRDRPFERPLFSYLGARSGPGEEGNVGYALTFRNTGQHPATSIHFQTRAAPKENPGQVVLDEEETLAHECPPGGDIHLMVWPKKPLAGTSLVRVTVTYASAIERKKRLSDVQWLVIYPDGAVGGMDQAERVEIERVWKSPR
jgi:hypothetical protein